MWRVEIKKKSFKNLKKLPSEIVKKFKFLTHDLAETGPVQSKWSNYSKLGENKHHCHLNYSYVACWTEDKKDIKIEVYYVGSREKAPY